MQCRTFYCLYIINPLGGCPILELEDHLTQSSPFLFPSKLLTHILTPNVKKNKTRRRKEFSLASRLYQ